MNKSFSIKESLTNPLFLVGLFLMIQIIIRPENMFISDPLVKAVQTFSLKFYNYSSQQIYYPAVDIDPNFELNPMTEGFVFYNNGRYIGTFPVAISFLYSIVNSKYIKFFSYFNIVLLIPFIYFFRKSTDNFSTVIFSLFGSVLFSTLIDYSENSIYYLMVGIGYLFLVESLYSNMYKKLFFGGLILSLSIWFRLESILFIFSFLSSIFIVSLIKNNFTLLYKKIIITSITSIFLTFIFFLYNFLFYSSILGPRFLFNYKEVSFSFINKATIFLSILFTFPRENNIAIGFYFYSPIFLLVIYYFIKKFKENSPLINIHLLTILIFSFLVGVLSPNDGITITGRYMACGVFPLVFLMDQFLLETTGKYKYLKVSLISFSFIISSIVVITFHFISKEFKKHSVYLNSQKADLYITSNELIGGSFSLGYLEKKIITIRRESDLVKLETILRENQFKSISLIGYNQSSNSVYNPILNMRDISLKTNYKCNDENHLIYRVHNCSK